MRSVVILSLVLGSAALSACGDKAKEEAPAVPTPPRLETVLPNMPLPPGGQPLVTEGGSEAVGVVVITRAMPDSVVDYYRKLFTEPPYRLLSENKTGVTTAFYVEQNGPSLWVTVSPNGTEGSQVVIAGAKSDSTSTTPGKAKAPGSSS